MNDSPVWSDDESGVSPMLFSSFAGVFSSAGESSSEALAHTTSKLDCRGRAELDQQAPSGGVFLLARR